MGFMSELCFCSHKELITIFPRSGNFKTSKVKSGSSSAPLLSFASTTLLFPRLVDVMLKCVKSGRPTMHIFRAWAVVGTHLMEVSLLRSITSHTLFENFPFLLQTSIHFNVT
jgi:hypothetical protein